MLCKSVWSLGLDGSHIVEWAKSHITYVFIIYFVHLHHLFPTSWPYVIIYFLHLHHIFPTSWSYVIIYFLCFYFLYLYHIFSMSLSYIFYILIVYFVYFLHHDRIFSSSLLYILHSNEAINWVAIQIYWQLFTYGA